MIVFLFLLLLADSVRLQNMCHADCAAFQCHGPDARHCGECTGNRVATGIGCSCKAGYFDSTTGNRCSAFGWDCRAGVAQTDGSVACSQCYHNR